MIEESFEELIQREQFRQDYNVELIASENFPSQRVLNAAGSILTNKYAEGYPGRRYYGGCEWIDKVEQKAIDTVCKLFDCKFANVQPHCGSSANQAVYRAFCKPGDTVMGMNLDAGGHLTHGHKLSFSGQDYKIVSYGVNKSGLIDYDEVRKLALEYKPRMIIAGASAYSRIIDFKKFREIVDDLNKETEDKCYLMVDMAHIAGLVAGGVHPSPLPYADVVTSTTHKTLRGPRGGLILWNNEEYTKKINAAVFPGVQGGPLEHIIAAKGICFEEALSDDFKAYAKQIIANTNAFAEEFKDNYYTVVSNGTDNHLFILDVYNSKGITGKQAEEELDKINITVNKNQIPGDTLSPLVSSGIRIGTAAMTTKGWKENDFRTLTYIIDSFLTEVRLGKPIDYELYIGKVTTLIKAIRERELN